MHVWRRGRGAPAAEAAAERRERPVGPRQGCLPLRLPAVLGPVPQSEAGLCQATVPCHVQKKAQDLLPVSLVRKVG